MSKLIGMIERPLVQVAHWLSERGYQSASVALYMVLAKLQRDVVRALYYRVQALKLRGQISEAVAALETVLHERPDFAQGHCEHGWLLQQVSRDSEAVEAFDHALRIDASVAAWHAARGLSLLRLNRTDEAEMSFRRALRHDDRCCEALFNLGVLLSGAGRHQEAIDCYRTVLKQRPDTEARVNLSHLLEVTGRLQEAAEVLRQGLHDNPNEPALTSILASVLRGQGQAKEAEQVLRVAESRTPENFLIVATRVELLVELGEHEEAVAVAERLATIHPGAASQAILGWARLETGAPEAALEGLNAAFNACQQEEELARAEIAGLRAAALVMLGKHREAEAIFDQLERDCPRVFVTNPDLVDYAERSRQNSGSQPKRSDGV